MKNYSFKISMLVSLFIFLLCTQCKQKEEAASEVTTESLDIPMATSAVDAKDAAGEPPALPNQQNPVPTTSTTDTNIQRMLTKEGTLNWETYDIDKTHTAILAQAKKYNAYISHDNQYRDDYQITTKVEMRIPSDKFDEFISTIEKEVTKFDQKNIQVLDVTEEYIDVAARLKTKKELEQHYYDLLKQTKNVTEVLQVEQQLTTVRGDIESAEGRLKYLKDRVSMSTLNLTFYETTSVPVGFFGEIGKNFVEGWKGFLYFILGAISIWPMLIIISLVIFWIIRRRRRK